MVYLFLHTAYSQAVKIMVENGSLDLVPDLIAGVPVDLHNPFIRIEVLEKVDTGTSDKPFVWNLIERII